MALLVGGEAVAAPGAEARTFSPRGLGDLHWGASPEAVERRAGVELDCSGGLTPGTCLCPESSPSLHATPVFADDRLMAIFAYGARSPATSRGIRVGSTRRAIRRAYPSAKLVRGGLGGGLATYYRVRRGRHALVLMLDGGRVSGISSYRDVRDLEDELCA